MASLINNVNIQLFMHKLNVFRMEIEVKSLGLETDCDVSMKAAFFMIS